MAEATDNSRNEVEIDLDKYMSLIEKLDSLFEQNFGANNQRQ